MDIKIDLCRQLNRLNTMNTVTVNVTTNFVIIPFHTQLFKSTMSKKWQRNSNQLKNATLADFDLDLGADIPSASISLACHSLDQCHIHHCSIQTAPVSPIKGNVDSLQNSVGNEADWIDEPDGYIGKGGKVKTRWQVLHCFGKFFFALGGMILFNLCLIGLSKFGVVEAS